MNGVVIYDYLRDSDVSVMSSSKKSISECWLLVEWNSGGREVVFWRSVVSLEDKELKVGDALTVNRRGEQEAATLIARARDRETLESQLSRDATPAGPSKSEAPAEDEEDGFSSSASSWVPSDDDGVQSEDSAAESNTKKIKLERYKRQYTRKSSSSRILTPSNKANAVLNMVMKQRSTQKYTKSLTSQSMNNTVTDIAVRKKGEKQDRGKYVTVLKEIQESFSKLFKMVDNLKQPAALNDPNPVHPEEAINQLCDQMRLALEDNKHQMDNIEDHEATENMDTIDNKENVNEMSENDEFNRSDDNVLISNRYSNRDVETVPTNNIADKEWVPIGTGQTLIHKDNFRKVNWKSYTVATRTLLLAAFPRKILATHSLTGKRSPAFQNKPAKMCLDPKITSDVIIEVMDRFNVRENLVRSIITTKCADESKMLRTRNIKKKMSKRERQETEEN